MQDKTRSHGANSMEHNSLSSRGVNSVLQQLPCSTSAEILGATVKDGDWPHAANAKACLYGGSMASLLSTSLGSPTHASQSSGNWVHHMREGVMNRELIDRMGGNKNPNVPSLNVSISQKLGHPMEKILDHGSSQSSDAPILAIDPCKGGFDALQGVGLATSHCLTQNFSSNPTFVEQATNFSSFNGDVDHFQDLGQPLSMLTNSPKSHSRLRRGQQAHESNGKLSRTSSSSIGVKIGGDAVSNFQTCLDGMKVNIVEHDSQGTQVCANSDDEKEPCGHASSLLSLEAIEGAKESNVVDGAIGLESSNLGIQLIHGTSDAALEKKRKSLTQDDKDHASLCQKSMMVDNEDTKHKRCKVHDNGQRKSIAKDEVQKPKVEGTYNDNSNNDSTQDKLKEMTPKKLPHVDISKQDYIHVRARRGQATDSHSLAERVRREKISERMKYLQDLVPGCSKVTGKALMLDEIINYVQSLQRQVEHLSMKLASMPPQMDVVNFDPVITKEMLSQSHGITSVVDHASLFNHHAKLQQPLSQLGGAIGVGAINLRRSLSCNLETGSNCDTTQLCRSPSSMDGIAFQDSEIQGSIVWDGDLQSIVQMGILQCGPTSMMSQGLNCHLPVGHMKVEL